MIALPIPHGLIEYADGGRVADAALAAAYASPSTAAAAPSRSGGSAVDAADAHPPHGDALGDVAPDVGPGPDVFGCSREEFELTPHKADEGRQMVVVLGSVEGQGPASYRWHCTGGCGIRRRRRRVARRRRRRAIQDRRYYGCLLLLLLLHLINNLLRRAKRNK